MKQREGRIIQKTLNVLVDKNEIGEGRIIQKTLNVLVDKM